MSNPKPFIVVTHYDDGTFHCDFAGSAEVANRWKKEETEDGNECHIYALVEEE